MKKGKKIDWKAVRAREAYFLKNGRFPSKLPASKEVKLIFGHNTISH